MRALLLMSFVLGIFLPGCWPLPPHPVAPEARKIVTVSTGDQVAIYQTVIRYLFDPSIPGGSLSLYIVRATNDAAADPSVQTPVSGFLPAAVQEGITAALGDFPTQVVWVDTFDDVQLTADTGVVIGGGVIVQLGNIRLDDSSRALVAASIYAREQTSGGALYVVEKRARIWAVTGTRGGFWSTQ